MIAKIAIKVVPILISMIKTRKITARHVTASATARLKTNQLEGTSSITLLDKDNTDVLDQTN
jgi:hypothetical protein